MGSVVISGQDANGAKCPILRSATESISINFGGATQPSGAKYYLYIEWTEDAA